MPVTDTTTVTDTVSTTTTATTTLTVTDTVSTTTTATLTVTDTVSTTTTVPGTVTTTAVSTTTVVAPTVTTTVANTTTLAPSTVTTTQTLVAPTVTATTTAAPVTVVMTETILATVTAAPPNTVIAASLIVDGTVQLMGPRTFALTGSISPDSDVAQIEFYAEVNGRTHDLGAATLNKDGTFNFSDHIARGTQSFITAVGTDAAGGTSTEVASFSLSTGAPDAKSGARQDRYDPVTGAYSGATVFYPNGAPKTITSVAPDGTPLLTVHFRPDGSSVTEIQAPGQTVTSSSLDTFNTRGHVETTFVFNPGFGHDTVDHFRANGKKHDTLVLPSSDFTSLVDVLHHTKDRLQGAVIHDPVSGDTIKLAGVSKDDLAANTDDIKFHG